MFILLPLVLATSRPALKLQFQKALEWKSNLWMGALLDIAEYRYGNEPEFRRIIGLAHYENSIQEWDLAFESLNNVINSKSNSDLKITPLLRRAEMWEKVGKWGKAVPDLEEAQAYIISREERGVTSMDYESRHQVAGQIEFDRKQMQNAGQGVESLRVDR